MAAIDQAIAWIEARMNEIGHLALRLWMGTRRGAASLGDLKLLEAVGMSAVRFRFVWRARRVPGS